MLLFLPSKTDERVAAGRRVLAARASLRVLTPPCPRDCVVNPRDQDRCPRAGARGYGLTGSGRRPS